MEGDPSDDATARARVWRHALHDLANVLTCILAAASHRSSDRSEAERHLDAIATAAELGRRLLNALRSVPGGMEGPTRVHEVLSSASVLLRCVGQPRRVEVSAAIEDVMVPIPGHELQEIVINLGLNAIEAMPGGGRLAITASALGDRVRIAVQDDGDGVEPGLLDHLSSSKGPSRGAGLASVLRILARAGGSIDAVSDDSGTCFVVDLPRA